VSSVPIRAAQAPETTERRAHPRRRLDQLVYIGFGPDSGGVLLDISEGGLRCQIVGAVVEGGLCHLKFALPGRHSAIETDGQVVWSNKSKQGGGVRLLGLCEDVRQQLQQWLRGEIPSYGGGTPIPISSRTKTIAAVHVLPSRSDTDAAVPAPEIPVTVAQKLPVTPPTPPPLRALLNVHPQWPLATGSLQKRNRRATGIAAVVACIVLGAAALVLSDTNLASVMGLGHGATQSGLAAMTTSTTADSVAGVAGASSRAGLLDEYSTPPLSGNVNGYASPVLSEPARPEVLISKSVPAPSDRPVQRPPAVARENRQRLAMALPRPRMAAPGPPLAALPLPATGDLVAPPIVFTDPQLLDTRLPELAQPVQPQTGTTYQQPELIARVEPVYSRFAREARVQGTVQISATISPEGVPQSLGRVSGNAALAAMAIEAVRQWRYQPALLNGQPVEAHTVITFNFQLR